jgi:hypothetical protein
MKEPCGDNRCIKIGLEESFIKRNLVLIPHSQYMTRDKPAPAQNNGDEVGLPRLPMRPSSSSEEGQMSAGD